MRRTTKLTDEMRIIRYPETGFDPEPTTICSDFTNACKEWADNPAVVSKDDQVYTYSQYYDNALQFAKSLINVGLNHRDVCSMIGFNSPEYYFAIHGTWLAGGVSTGIYTTNNPEACAYLLNHSEAKICLCQGGRMAVKIASIADQVPTLKAIIVYWPEDGLPELSGTRTDVKIYTWDDFLKAGATTPTSAVLERVQATKPGHCASIIYTSGTTGLAKGVMISHDACTFNTRAISHQLMCDNKDRWVSFLPLNHIAALFADVIMPTYNLITMYICKPDALKGSLVLTLRKVKPTFFVAVPRVYEKFMESIRATIEKSSTVKQYMARFFQWIGWRACLSRQFNQTYYQPYGYSLANSLTFSKIKASLGLDAVKMMVVSAAPISSDALTFFQGLDMPIYDLLGQSEATAPISLNSPVGQDLKFESAGRALRGTFLKSDPNSDELLYKGRHVMMGYLKMEKDTVNAIDDDGWLHSGDRVKIDADNFVFVTGRLKEIIVTAGGENVSPVRIENKLIELCPIIANCVVVGDKRKFLSCLISLRTNADAVTGEPTDDLTPYVVEKLKLRGSVSVKASEAREDAVVKQWIECTIEMYNNNFADSQAASVRRWYIIEKDFSIGSGELTATMKMKRNIVHANYEKVIDLLYVNAANSTE